MSLDRAIAAMKRVTTLGFSREITFTTPDNSLTVIARGLVSKHNLSINPETGLPVNSKNAHISVAESNLIDVGYPTRNADNEIALVKHRVSWVDASGQSFTFLIDDCMPSETTGLIVCTLGILE
jgi:hypothetical protein